MPTLLARGTITISKMDDVYEIKLAPWTVSIPSNSDGSNPVLSSAKTRLVVNKDAVLMTTEITSIVAKNCTAAFLGNEVSVTAVSADSGEVEITFKVEDQTRSAVFTWAKAKQGNAGTDSYTVVLDNEAHSIPATSTGAVTLADLDKATSGIRAWKGSTELTAVAANAAPANNQYRYNITTVEGCTAVRVDNTRFKLSSMTADSAKVEVRIWVEGKQYIDKTMSITKSRSGAAGEIGAPGSSITGRGIYLNTKIYTGSAIRSDVVNYNGVWYRAKRDAGSFSGIPPTGHGLSTDKWEPFGGEFESVATDILFAQDAFIAKLGSPDVYIGDGLNNVGWRLTAGRIESLQKRTDGVTPMTRLTSDGKLSAQDVDLTGKITATSGKVASFSIDGSDLRAGEPWILNGQFVNISPGDLLFRKIGSNTAQVIEMAFGYAGLGQYDGLRLKNTITNSIGDNRALVLEARNGQTNIALDIASGGIRVQGQIGKTYDQDLDGTWTLRFVNGIYIGTFRK